MFQVEHRGLLEESIGMFAKSAMGNTERENTRGSRSMPEGQAKCPRYMRGLLWTDNDAIVSSTAQWSLTAKPMPDVPLHEFQNKAATDMLESNPHLFKVVCPVNVECFHDLLVDHPNQPLKHHCMIESEPTRLQDLFRKNVDKAYYRIVNVITTLTQY